MESFESGVLLGYPVVDVEAVLKSGSFKESLGTDLAYTVSASMACKEALLKGEPFLLEPIMSVEIPITQKTINMVQAVIDAKALNLSGNVIITPLPPSRSVDP